MATILSHTALLTLVSLLSAVTATAASATDVASDRFVSLADIDASIVIEMRYFGKHNFLGHAVKGYQANTCLLIKDAALALSKVQKALARQSLSLKIYDCYRPQMAVSEFMVWAQDSADKKMKREFYPNEDKDKLIARGYIAARSGHSRGDSIDLTIINLPVAAQRPFDVQNQQDCTGAVSQRYPDNSLNMGTGYDCFDLLSHTLHPDISGVQRKNRLLLKDIMERHGYRNYKKEWWHYTYIKPYGEKQFYNFPVK